MSPRSQVTNVYAAEAVQLLFYMRRTRTATYTPHGNANWTSKPSATTSLPIGRMVQTIINPILGSTNSCVLTKPRASSPAPKVKATSRVPTDSSLTMSTAPAFYPLFWYYSFDSFWWLCKIKQPSNVLERYVVRFLDNPGPVLIDLSDSAYNMALHAPCSPWCLQTHGRTNPLQGVLHG